MFYFFQSCAHAQPISFDAAIVFDCMSLFYRVSQIHVFIGYKPHQLVPDLLQDIKGSSSKWINKKGFIKGKFKWQEGNGAFSYSHSQIDSVVKYIMNQEQHHKKKTFREEYVELLKRFNIRYDEKYILKDVE